MSVPQRNADLIRSHLLRRRNALTHRYRRVEQDLGRQYEPLVADSGDQAIQLQNDETLEAIGSAAREEIAAIDAALERLSHGHYGTCAVCGEEIPPTRLEAVPHAVTCASCATR
jgi:DnaK suppressor protein